MSNTSRRDFLKGSAAAVVGGTLISPSKAEAKTVTEADFGIEKKVPLLCRICAQNCPMLGTVLNGRLVRLEANMSSPYAAICGRGRAAMGALYDPDRIKTPLIRVGERGEGKFRKASWDEALDMVSGKMKELASQNDQKALTYFMRFSSAGGMDANFFKIYGTPNSSSYGDTCWAAAYVSLGSVFGGKLEDGNPTGSTAAMNPDYEHAKYAVMLQRNPAGAMACHAWSTMLGRGKRNGIKLCVVDPRKPNELGETDTHWVPIRPGTDAPFLLGLMHEIFKNNYFDAAYLAKHTNSDMLVDTQTGLPVNTRMIEKEVKGKKVEILDYWVASETGFDFKSETPKALLFGEHTLNIEGKSVTCKTALQMMKDEAAQYTPEWAQEKSTIPAQEIMDIAKNLNDAKPACFIERGYRSERYASSFREKLLIIQINLLLGSFGVKGGWFWNRMPGVAGFIKAPKPEGQHFAQWYRRNDPNNSLMSLKGSRRTWARSCLEAQPYKQRMAFIYGENMVGGSSGSQEIIEALKSLEMVAVVSPFLSETIMYADVVLPDCTFMERDEGLQGKYKSALPTIGVNRKAVEPMYESKDGYWIISQLAKRTLSPEVYEEHFGFYEREGMMGIWKKQYSKISGITDAEQKTLPPLESILNGRLWTGEKQYGIKHKGTPTDTIEIYPTFLAKKKVELDATGFEKAGYASPLPSYDKPFWLEQKETLDNNEFIPITGFHPLGSFGSQQAKNNPLLKTLHEQANVNKVFINAKKGKALGLKTDDLIEVINTERPDMVSTAIVVLSEVVHPDALFTYYSIAGGHFNDSAKRQRVASDIGFNPNHVGNFKFNPLTAGQPSQDFIVSIRKST